MKAEKPICLFDGIKIRIYDQGFVSKILSESKKYNLKLLYDEDRKLCFPLKGHYNCFSDTSDIKNENGYIIELKNAQHNGVTKECVEITFSFHKYFNQFKQNASIFYWEDFIEVLSKVQIDFGFCCESAYVVNLEIGANIIIPQTFNIVSKELTKNLVFVKLFSKAEVEEYKNRRDKGYNNFYKNTSTITKIYAKSSQYPEYSKGNEIIRIETKLIKGRQIEKSLKIKSYADLCDPKVREASINLFKKRFKKIIFYQEELEKINPDELQNLIKYKRVDFWQDAWRESPTKCFDVHRKKYFELIEKAGIENVSAYILSKIQELE